MSDVGFRACRGCGARFERMPWALDQDLRASPECWHAYGELQGFQSEHGARLGGLTQLVVDAYGAQHAGGPTPPIRVVYGLVGLYLALERGLDGDAVRDVHARMGAPRPDWPSFDPPSFDPPSFDPPPASGVTTVVDVLREGRDAASPDGHERAVRRWAEQVWASWADRRADVVRLTGQLFPGEFDR